MNYQYYIPKQTVSLPTDKKIVLVGGCFDIIHFGHIQFLEKAKQTGDYLIIALEPDERIAEYKKRMPVHTQKKRAYNLSSLRYVDQVIMLPLLHGFDDYLALVKNIKPDIIAITDGDPQLSNKQKQADAINARLVVVTNVIGEFSSSAIYKNLMI